MSLKASKQIGPNRYELEVAVDAEAFENAVQKAYVRQNKKIVIPGFRKGKAPRKFVEKYYGEQVFYEDAVNAVYPDALDEAIHEAALEVIEDKMDLDIVEVGKNGLVFKACVTTKPEVTIEGYKGLEVTKKSTDVTDEMLDKEIEGVQLRNSRLVSVDDRAAQKDDIVNIDFEGFVDDVAFEGGKAEKYNLTLGSGQFIPGFEDQIIGHNIGDEFDVNVTFPEDYQAEDLKGKAAVFKVKLHEIKFRELPELDDEFAKDVSEFDTLEEYKADVKTKLAERLQKEADDDVENQLIDQLVEKVQGDIPEAMYENKISDDVRDFSYRLKSQGLDLESYMKYTQMDMEAIRKGFRPQAERQVKVRLALEKIAQLEEIKPTEEEIEAEYNKVAENFKVEVDQVKKLIAEADLSKDVAVEKAINLVRDSAVIK